AGTAPRRRLAGARGVARDGGGGLRPRAGRAGGPARDPDRPRICRPRGRRRSRDLPRSARGGLAGDGPLAPRRPRQAPAAAGGHAAVTEAPTFTVVMAAHDAARTIEASI